MFRDIFTTENKDPSLERWLLAAAVTLAVAVLLHFLRTLIIRKLRDIAPKTVNLWDDVLLEIARRTSWIFHIAMGLAVARWVVTIPPVWERRWKAGIAVIAVVQAGLWCTGIVDYLLLAHLDKRNSGEAAYQTSRNMVRFITLFVVWVAATLLVMENVGINVSTLVAGLGVTGVAVAFATQNVLGDLFASISLLLDKPFLAGDFIITDTFMGTVERIGIRSTRVRSLSGEALVFPNSDLSRSRLRNYRTQKERRVVFNFALSYDTPVEKLEQVGGMVRSIITKQNGTRFDRAHWLSFGDKGLVFEVVYYVLSGDYNVYMDIQQAINFGIMRELRDAAIRLAYGTVLTGEARSA